jgi:FtsP/CotA-like multicopper oxidase with cupredoxin domain
MTKLVAATITALALSWASTAAAQANPVCPLPGQAGTCTMATPLLPLDPALQPKYAYDLPVPIFYVPDTTTFPGFDYYEIQMKEVTQAPVAFPQPPAGSPAQPAGTQWLGLVDPATLKPLYTPVWGYAQSNNAAGYALNGLATYPSMSFKATKGRPVKVKWVNALQSNNHLFCPKPLDSNTPCAIDRTLMGTLLKPGELVNSFGTKMQPDNAMVVHLHGGEIPPDSDGFAELWIGNATTAAAYGPGGAYYTAPTTAFACTGTTDATCTSAIAGVTTNFDPTFKPPVGSGIPTDAMYQLLNYDGQVQVPKTCSATVPCGTGETCTAAGTCSLTCSAAIACPTGQTCVYPKPGAKTGACSGTITVLVPSGKYSPGQLIRPLGNSIYYNYPMVQNAATIWYHDHTLGKTRINVAAGPAGYFYITDPAVEGPLYSTGALPPVGDCSVPGVLAGNCYDVPIVFQDRDFNADGTINFPNGLGQAMAGVVGWNPLTPGPNPTVHPQWVPEYFGGTAVVNGTIWPRLKVEPRPYRFRLLDGSNARCYTLDVKDAAGKLVQPPFYVIGSDQGYLPTPQLVNRLTMCPGERYDVVIDFSAYANGVQFLVNNYASAPFPTGLTPNTGGGFAQMAALMRFDVAKPLNTAFPAAPFVAKPLITINKLVATPGAPAREMVLNEVLDPVTLAPLRVQIDGKPFEAPVTETPKRGTTEVWSFVNTTVDAHPIHLHLVQYQVVSRQKFNANAYSADTGFGVPGNSTFNKLPVAPYLSGSAAGPLPQETGFKDTAISYPGEVLTVIAKWDGGWPDSSAAPGAAGQYYEPVTSGPYVWHCHIVDHEDNEMMRPSLVLP